MIEAKTRQTKLNERGQAMSNTQSQDMEPLSGYEKGLRGIAPAGMTPRTLRVERWEAAVRGRPKLQTETRAHQTPELARQAERYINSWVEAMYQDEPGPDQADHMDQEGGTNDR
jgi:hypothetical protein